MIRIHNIGAILLLVFLSGQVFAQDSFDVASDYEAKENNWRFIISPYALFASNHTDVGGNKMRQSFSDLSSLTNFGFQLAANVVYKKWVLTGDGTYANLGANGAENFLSLNLDIKQVILDLRLGYLVHTDTDFEDDSGVVRGWAMEVNAGAKYWRNDVTLDYSVLLGDPPPLIEDSFSTVQSWWDPMVGVKARIVLSRSVLLGLSLSGGGFGVGNSSEYSWDWAYTNTFKVSSLLSVTAGYRSFSYKRVDGEGSEELETKVSVLGPLVGVSFVF